MSDEHLTQQSSRLKAVKTELTRLFLRQLIASYQSSTGWKWLTYYSVWASDSSDAPRALSLWTQRDRSATLIHACNRPSLSQHQHHSILRIQRSISRARALLLIWVMYEIFIAALHQIRHLDINFRNAQGGSSMSDNLHTSISLLHLSKLYIFNGKLREYWICFVVL